MATPHLPDLLLLPPRPSPPDSKARLGTSDWWYTARMAPKKKTKKKKTKKVARRKAKPIKKARKPKLTRKSAAGARKTAAGKTKRVRRKSETDNTVALRRKGFHRATAGNPEICRDCPAARARIRRAWTNCSRKETPSKPRW